MNSSKKRLGRRQRRFGAVIATGAAVCLGSTSGCEAWQIAATTVGVLAAVAITYAAIKHYEKRKATEREEAAARVAADERRAALASSERVAIQEDRARLAVPVGETETEQLVMLVDADSGELVGDQVYSVPKESIAKLPDGNSVETDNPTVASAEPFPAENIRFGQLGSEKVIFRL